jgi:hypothetical protein
VALSWGDPAIVQKSMFHFAWKIKRPEVAGGPSIRPVLVPPIPRLESSAKALVFDCTQLSAF